MEAIRAIAFDLDGTLVDSLPDLTAAINAMLAALGRPGVGVEAVSQWIGHGVEVLVKRCLSGSLSMEAPLDEVLVVKAQTLFDHYYRQHSCRYARLYDGVKETLEQLRADGYLLAVITNKRQEFTLPLLEGVAIEHLFDRVICGDSLANKKPAPDQLLSALDHWQLSPAQMLMVGDSKNDILAARACKVPVAGVSYGYNPGEDIRLCGADWILDHFSQLLPLLTAPHNPKTN